ncbi:MAG: glycoside hydrolase family 15 protein, partial [Actinobacteria bacterium]|nr:glycoside hydrolase family 15 protein [Actinomycetota bacterium]
MPQRTPRAEQSTGGSPPHALNQYALLADGERGILVGPRGDFVWMCFPQWADEAVFSSLMGGGGEYSLHPVGRYVWGGYYEPGSLVWRSRWVTEDNAIVECREALALPAHASRAVVLRRVIARAGTARMSV